jgi:Glycine transporter
MRYFRLFLLSSALLLSDASFLPKTSSAKLRPLDIHTQNASTTTTPLATIRGGALAPPTPDKVAAFLNAMDLLGTAVFAFSGALTAGKKGMDLLGMLIVSTITSFGGGTLRDLLLDSGTVF